jgi:hypothetical protein
MPDMVLVYLVSTLYMPIVPIIVVVSALAFFSGSYIVWKHQWCLHVYAAEFEGGAWW